MCGREKTEGDGNRQHRGLFVCDVDLATGHCRQFPVGLVQADFPTASLRSPSTGITYIGSAWLGHRHRSDPALPYRFATGPGANPLDVGPIDDDMIGYRPHFTVALPDGK